MGVAINRWSRIAVLSVAAFGCASQRALPPGGTEQLTAMVAARERAMVERNVDAAMEQFADDATWINSQGYFFEGKAALLGFHRMLTRDDAAYTYTAGKPRIRMLDANNALAYYSWKMFWHTPRDPSQKTTYEEIGLMTLTAQKRDGAWKWVAVTNQHTADFYPEINPVTVD